MGNDPKNMRGIVLVTGGTGFVGKHVLDALADCGVRVRLVVRKDSGKSNLNLSMIDEIIQTDDLFLEDSFWWAKTCQGVEVVIHLAWYAETGKYLNSEKNMDCVIGTLQFAKGCAVAGVRRFIGIGSCFEYDLGNGMLSVDTPLLPMTPYACAKVATYVALSQWLPGQGVEFVWARLFYLYGDGENIQRLVPHIRAKLSAGEHVELTRGEQIRDYIDVKDAAKMIIHLALGDRTGSVNVCSGIPITVRQLAEAIADEYGRRDLLKFGARPENTFDPPCVLGIKS